MLVEPGRQNAPGVQKLQGEPFTAEKLPSGQMEHAEEPAAEPEPAGAEVVLSASLVATP